MNFGGITDEFRRDYLRAGGGGGLEFENGTLEKSLVPIFHHVCSPAV